jgi:hypothetical protein
MLGLVIWLSGKCLSSIQETLGNILSTTKKQQTTTTKEQVVYEKGEYLFFKS